MCAGGRNADKSRFGQRQFKSVVEAQDKWRGITNQKRCLFARFGGSLCVEIHHDLNLNTKSMGWINARNNSCNRRRFSAEIDQNEYLWNVCNLIIGEYVRNGFMCVCVYGNFVWGLRFMWCGKYVFSRLSRWRCDNIYEQRSVVLVGRPVNVHSNMCWWPKAGNSLPIRLSDKWTNCTPEHSDRANAFR